jgi:probable H4MPT-linked C1 transfer pathway protein
MPIVGWDIGGSNVKAARIDGDGEPVVIERPFALWREPQRLPDVLKEIAGRIGEAPAMAVTMTAELADCFATKREGVAFVVDAVTAAFPGTPIGVFGVDGRFRTPADARQEPLVVAAANWMASAMLVARRYPESVLIDAGSTTTDLIPIADGEVVARGQTDPDRLLSGELVYTGALRTPVCAIVQAVPLRGHPCRVAAEHFAIAADAHRWLEHLDEADYTCETADGRGRSRAEAATRLARMVCADRDMLDDEDITAIAEHVAHAQVHQISDALRQVLDTLLPHPARVAVLAGQGRFLARAAVADLAARDPSTSLAAIVDIAVALGPSAARHTAAAAVAYLLAAND